MEIGPQLPQHLSDNQHGGSTTVSQSCTNSGEQKHNDEDIFGPSLPPCFKTRPTIIGPCKPERAEQLQIERKAEDFERDEDDVDEHEVIGPQLPTKSEQDEYLRRKKEEIECRAQSQKDELLDNKGKRSTKTVREEWMTELPPELGKNFGVGARTFRTRDIELGDRSVWTDTPSGRAKKQNASETKEAKQAKRSKKDIDTEEYVNKHNKRFRGESLLNTHRQDLKKKQDDEGSSGQERRPFDRETDLGLRQMDAAKKKTLIKQSSNLNSKFRHSKDGSTYL